MCVLSLDPIDRRPVALSDDHAVVVRTVV